MKEAQIGHLTMERILQYGRTKFQQHASYIIFKKCITTTFNKEKLQPMLWTLPSPFIDEEVGIYIQNVLETTLVFLDTMVLLYKRSSFVTNS